MIESEKNKEVEYYEEIIDFTRAEIQDIFNAICPEKNLKIYFKTNTGKKENEATSYDDGLKKILYEHPAECNCLRTYINTAPKLKPDIYFVVTDTKRYSIGIIEVKIGKGLGLINCSQLIGYCIAADVEVGLLINVDCDVGGPLYDISSRGSRLTKIDHIVGGEMRNTRIGILRWNSPTQTITSTGRGDLQSIEEVCEYIASKFP